MSILFSLHFLQFFLYTGKISMKDQEYQKELGATVACAICAGEGTRQVKEAKTALIVMLGLDQ